MPAQPARNWANLVKRRNGFVLAVEAGTNQEYRIDQLSRSDLSRLVGMVGGFRGSLVGADVHNLRAHIIARCESLAPDETFYHYQIPTPEVPVTPPTPTPTPEVPVVPDAPPPPPAGSLEGMLASIATDAAIRALAEYRATIDAQVAAAVAAIDKPIVTVRVERHDQPARIIEGHTHPKFANVMRLMGRGLHVMLVGPAGSGKSHLASQVSDAFDRPFFMVNCSADMGRHDLFGYSDATGAYVNTPLFDSLRAGDDGLGGTFLLDEADAATPDVLVSYNGLAAQRHAVFGRTMHKAGPEWRTIMACNTFGLGPNATYPGRRPMDFSTKDRFMAIHVDYDRVFERKMAAELLGSDDRAVRWVMAIDKMRANVVEHKLAQVVVSSRMVIDGAISLDEGFTAEEVLDMKALAGIEGTVREKVLAGVDLSVVK